MGVILFSEMGRKPLGVMFLVIVAIVILALRGKIKRSSNLGRGILFAGDVYTFVRFFSVIFSFLIIFLILLKLGSNNKKDKERFHIYQRDRHK